MNNKARNELIAVTIGMIMVILGVVLLMYNTTVTSAFLESGDNWTWWRIILVLLPLVAGIIMLLWKPHLLISKIIAVTGALIVIIVILINTTIIIDKGMTIFQWLLCGLLILVGFGITIGALFLNKKKKTD